MQVLANRRRPGGATVFAATGIALVLAVAVGLALGAVHLSPSQVVDGLLDRGDPVDRRIVWDLRAPRVLVAALVGVNLSIAGVILQGVTRNPLAGPHVLGFSAGAGFAVAIVVVGASGTPVELAAPAAFVGALAAGLVVYALAWRGGVSPSRFALSGVATAALFTAMSTAVIANSDLFTQAALNFLAGGLFGSGWDDFGQIWPYTLVAGLVAALAASALNVLALGDDVAKGLGMRVDRTRFGLVVVAAVLTGSAVAVSGLLAFVGLVVPHAARALVGSDHLRVVPLAALIGATLLVLADALARVVIAPAEMPVGIITAVVGAPVFLLLIRMRT